MDADSRAQLPARSVAAPNGSSALRPKKVLLIFNLLWDDAKAMLMGVSQYVQGTWDVTIDVDAAALKDTSWFEGRHWDGVITRHSNHAMVEVCAARKIPLVDLDDVPKVDGVAKIRPDNRAVGHMGAEHFLERGFKNFGFCGLDEPWSTERYEGFAEALGLVDMACDNFHSAYPGFNPEWNQQQRKLLHDWVSKLPRPVAVMACNDFRAMQLVSVCREAGVLVPNEVAVLGVNNDYLRCAFGTPPLSSVATDRQLAGFRAAEVLDMLMLEGKWSSVVDVRIDPIRVVVRQSTDVLAVEDEHVRAALHYIREFGCKGITAEDVAGHVRLSRYALERRFKQLIGRSPHTEIRAVQIARIKQLLTETDMPLKNIAELVGVPHTEYVSVMFNRHVGMAPGAYRKKHQPKAAAKRMQSATDPDMKQEI